MCLSVSMLIFCMWHFICRDLKPQNLLVDKEKGLLKIADLGLGRAFTVPLKSYTHEVRWFSRPTNIMFCILAKI